MITNLCIWWLRMKKVSVLIGCKVPFGTIKQLNYSSFIYDNELGDGLTWLDADGNEFVIPKGKFHIKG